MAGLHRFRSQLLEDGKITEDEVGVIRDYIISDGQLDLEDVKFLVELLSEADEVCSAFDELFFPVLKAVLSEDGRVTMDEHFYLLKMLYSDGHIRDSEKQFLRELRAELEEVSPAFDAMCEEAFGADPKNWDIGGRPRQGV